MKSIVVLFFTIFSVLMACNSSKAQKTFEDKPKLESDTIRISNEEIEYDVIIIDGGFTSWFNSYARPRNYYTQSYLEARNRIWVLEWNRRAMLPSQYNPNLYEMTINLIFYFYVLIVIFRPEKCFLITISDRGKNLKIAKNLIFILKLSYLSLKIYY